MKEDHPEPILCVLASNIVTHFELSSNGALAKCYSPLKIFELKGAKGFSTIIQLDKSQHIIHNKNDITVWLQTAGPTTEEGNTRIDAELFVR